MNQAIAIMDSGVGGLTVVREVLRQLPQEQIVYFGDTARAPYGPRPPEEVVRFTREIAEYLTRYKPKMLVLACNTATAVALDDIRSRVEIPVVGVIKPGARAAVKASRTGRIGVIGTEGTVKSGAYEEALREISAQLEIVSLACPDLVPLVEAGEYESPLAWEIVRRSLAPLQDQKLDSLILGCTHYPFLAAPIAEAMGPSTQLINSAEETVREISAILSYQEDLAKREDGTPLHRFFCSGDSAIFRRITSSWLNQQVEASTIVWQVPTVG
ncbi:glutamate racemase [Gorillibacterium sp. sgz500922]|uniref:glutamate racemase n=1 Tax=Gorillibacterium sp. sgz500922 TaxID=3446694 RepID=UPI003F669F76